ncbi:MAG: glycoside hydrolase [Proteobacteria bacterium]|nr:glycoside hydrolase [Pseudomonadota bacterium]
MRKRPIFSVLFSLAVLLATPAQACRPFGSYGFAEDAEGGIWFTEGDNNAVSRLSIDGTVISHPLPTPAAEPSSVAVDRAGNVWFAEMDGRRIGRLVPDGHLDEYPVPFGQPFQVAVDGHGEVWFTVLAEHQHGEAGHQHEPSPSGIGHLDRAGQLRFYPVPGGWPSAIAFDSRDQAWVTLQLPDQGGRGSQGRLLRLSRDGQWQEEKAWSSPSCPRNLLADQQGGLYFSDGCRHSVSHRNGSGSLREWPLPGDTRIQGLSLAPDGRLWFTDRATLGYMDRHGHAVFLRRPAIGDATMAVLALRNGDLVFSEFYNYNINRRTKTGEYVEHLVNIEERRGSREVRDGEVCYVQFAARIAGKAEMDNKRAEEVRSGQFKPDGAGTEKLVEQKCLACHDARRLLLSRRSDWTPSLTRMHSYRQLRGVAPLTPEETARLVRYFNAYYGLGH